MTQYNHINTFVFAYVFRKETKFRRSFIANVEYKPRERERSIYSVCNDFEWKKKIKNVLVLKIVSGLI